MKANRGGVQEALVPYKIKEMGIPWWRMGAINQVLLGGHESVAHFI